MSKNVLVATDGNFQEMVLNSADLVVVDFWAEWCAPCRMIAPIMEKVAEEVKGKAVVCKLNVDENRKTAQAYGITAIPTTLFFKEGKVVDRIVGLDSKETIKKKIEANL